MQKLLQQILPTIKNRRFIKKFAIVAGVFLLINILTLAIYNNRTYPNTQLAGKSLGSIKTDSSFQGQVEKLGLVPTEVTLTYEGNDIKVYTGNFGVGVDYSKTAQDAEDRRFWIPVVNFLLPHDVPVYLAKDNDLFQKEVENLAIGQKKDPVDAKIVIQESNFVLKEHQTGSQPDTERTKEELLDGLQSGQQQIEVPVQTLEPKVKKSDLEQTFESLRKQQQTQLVFRFADKSKTYNATEIASWYVEEGSVMVLSDAKIKESIVALGREYGIGVQNLPQAISFIKDSLQNNKSLDFTLVEIPKPKKYFSYCTATRGVDGSHLSSLESKLIDVFKDKRGWGLEGQVILSKVTSGCDFTVWLAEASQMPSFGAICDSLWSCRVGPNVVINFDRWQGASSAWNASGGSLDDYRSMVINHEVGHWFGFYHKDCTGTGQPAPVMQQQSISLQGCVFNPWPLASERAALRSSLGL